MAREGHQGTGRWAAAALALAAAASLGAAPGCDGGPAFPATRSLTSTVALGSERALVVDAPTEVRVEGDRRRDEVSVALEATVTASAASTAARLAAALEVEVDRTRPGVLQLRLAAPEAASLGGRLTVRVPADLDLGVVGRGGPVDVLGMERGVDVVAATHARVEGALGSVRVRVERGNALVSSALSPGTVADLEVGVGDVQLTLPARPSAAIEASAGGGGSVQVGHPALPRAFGVQPYRAAVNGGLGAARLVARAGNVVILGP